jgi:hypothetical protein
MSGIKCTYPMTNTWIKSNYFEDKILQNSTVNKSSKNEASDQRIQTTNWIRKIS